MTIPVNLSDLDLATTADDGDLALIRKSNTTDYKVLVSKLRSINISALPSATIPIATDLMMISQSGTNKKVQFGSVGFISGTKMWFYQDTTANGVSPLFWSIVPNGDDKLLAVKGGSTYTTGGISQGTWQQRDVSGVTGMGLNINQIPNHYHEILVTNPSTVYGAQVQGGNKAGNKSSSTNGMKGSTNPLASNGCLPHNHGNNWRPFARVGIVCQKVA